MSENDGITVRQTVAHTVQLVTWGRYAMWFTPSKEKGTLIRSVPKPNSGNNSTGQYNTMTMGPH